MKISAATDPRTPQVMAWDTEFFGLKVGRATHLEGVTQWAVDNTIGLMCLLLDADEETQIQQAEDQGFRMMDVRVTLTRQTGMRSFNGVRLARAEDTATLKQIGRTAFRGTRFYADPRLPDGRCDDLYEEWVRSSCAGAADVVLVADRGGPVGFVTVNNRDGVGHLELIAVAEGRRREGIGAHLTNAAVDWAKSRGCTRIDVVTQGRNVDALRMYGACGFVVSQVQVWMHRWYA